MTHAYKHGYSSFQIAIHWTVAALLIAQILLGGAMARVFHALQEGEDVDSLGPAYIHVLLGVTILLIMIARFTVRQRRPVTVAPDSPHRLMAAAGRANHWAFYGMLFLIPVLGAIAWFGNSETAGDLHSLGILVLYVLIALHVSGVIVHHLMGDRILRRMVRPTGGT